MVVYDFFLLNFIDEWKNEQRKLENRVYSFT